MIHQIKCNLSLLLSLNFRQLISSCHCLTKLSVYHFIGSWEEKPRDLLRGILQNASTLKVLDLSKCESLSSNDIELIVKRCIKLTEANFGQMEHYSVSYLSRNLTTSIEKLGLPGTNATNEDIKVLVARCNKLKVIYLGVLTIYQGRGKKDLDSFGQQVLGIFFLYFNSKNIRNR